MAEIALYCSSTSWGGLEMNVVRVATWMRERGWTVCVYCQGDTPIDKEARLQGHNVSHVRRPLQVLDVPAAMGMLSELGRKRCSVVLAFLNRDISMLAWARRLSRAGIRTIYVQQMGLGVDKRDLLHTRRYAQLDFWLSPLESLRQEVLQRTRMTAQRVKVAPLGIDYRLFHSGLSQSQARLQLELKPEKKYLGVIGRLDPAKGQELAIRALAELRKRGRDLELVLMGSATKGLETSYEKQLRSFSEGLGLHDVVHFRSFRADTLSFYRSIDLCIMATRSETYGMVSVEAMMSGCAIVGTNSGGTPELLDHGRRGKLFEPDDVEGCVRAIENSLDSMSTDKLRSIADEVREKYSHDLQCTIIEQLLYELGIRKT